MDSDYAADFAQISSTTFTMVNWSWSMGISTILFLTVSLIADHLYGRSSRCLSLTVTFQHLIRKQSQIYSINVERTLVPNASEPQQVFAWAY